MLNEARPIKSSSSFARVVVIANKRVRNNELEFFEELVVVVAVVVVVTFPIDNFLYVISKHTSFVRKKLLLITFCIVKKCENLYINL